MLTILLIGLVMNLAVFAVSAQTKTEKAVKFAEKVKANVTKLGTGKKANVEVKLKGGTNIKGYVSQINENEFAMTDSKTGQLISVPYANVKQVERHHSTTSTILGVAAGIGLVIILIIILGNATRGA